MVTDRVTGKVKEIWLREKSSADETVGNEKPSYTPIVELSAEDKRIYLVCSAKAQGELLAAHIAKNTGVDCLLVEDLETAALSIRQNGRSVLLMRDCYRKSNEIILAELELVYHEKLSWTLCCLFNLESESGVEMDAVEYGVKGFFYEHDQLENLLRGINGVFQGEIWLSRKNMSEYIARKNNPQKPRDENSGESRLTQREIEILSKLAGGKSNQNIAEALFISPHTVKTHIYNIYKKIGVSDRLQAALWATKNL